MTNFRIQRAQEEIAKKRAEIADLEAFIRVESAMGPEAAATVRVPLSTVVAKAAETVTPLLNMIAADQQRRGAKKRAILSILDSYNCPMSTSAVLQLLPAMKIAGATTENTSPQLSAYKADGFVTLVDDGWKITNKGREYLAQKD